MTGPGPRDQAMRVAAQITDHTPTDSVRWLARHFVHLYGRDKIPGHDQSTCEQCLVIDVAAPRLEAALWSLNLGPGNET